MSAEKTKGRREKGGGVPPKNQQSVFRRRRRNGAREAGSPLDRKGKSGICGAAGEDVFLDSGRMND